MKAHARVFSKDSPCTKAEIWACFRGPMGFNRVPVVSTESQIGLNVPRVMERMGRLKKVTQGSVQYCVLTDEGEEWLLRGFQAYLKNHPAEAGKAKHVPASWGYPKAVRLRRTR